MIMNYVALFALCLLPTAAGAAPRTLRARQIYGDLQRPLGLDSKAIQPEDRLASLNDHKPIARTRVPSKFAYPLNFGTVKANEKFTISMQLDSIPATPFANIQRSRVSIRRQSQVDDMQGNSLVVIEELTSLSQTEVLDPAKFAFLKGLAVGEENVAEDGALQADVPDGLPAGAYRMSLVNLGGSPEVLRTPVPSHRVVGDVVYFTVEDAFDM
ncbi:hypothetical protein HGRIS_006989 [Hohenbuehelia grisea]|uniref:Uncharacterized protein n=1 Tax=Hohenbuehelia grisea TaxID=104357 RepID=A0ABR3JB44_9AGAR